MDNTNQNNNVPINENDLNTKKTEQDENLQANLIETLNQKLIVLQEELKKEKERNGYLMADADTFRRRSERECKQSIDAARVKIFSDLLRIADDFDRAFVEVDRKPELLAYLTGFELTYKTLRTILAAHGVVRMEITESQAFDPQFHEAIMQVDLSGKQSGEIVSVLQAGYLYNGALLRPAKVSVKG